MSNTSRSLAKFFKDPQIPIAGGIMVVLPISPIIVLSFILEGIFLDVPTGVMWLAKKAPSCYKNSAPCQPASVACQQGSAPC